MYNFSGTGEYLEVVVCGVVTIWCMFVLIFHACAAVVTIRNIKTTGVTVITVSIIIVCVRGVLWMLHSNLLWLLYLVSCLLWIRMIVFLLAISMYLYAWSIFVSISYVTMLMLWFPIYILGLLLLFYVVYMGGRLMWRHLGFVGAELNICGIVGAVGKNVVNGIVVFLFGCIVCLFPSTYV